MEVGKGKLGVDLRFYAVLAFALALFGRWSIFVLILTVVVGFALAMERNDWVNRQVLQALFLVLAIWVGCFAVDAVSGLAYLLGRSLDNWYGSLFFMDTMLYWVQTVISWTLNILLWIGAILGMMRTAKGQEAKIPGVSGLANKACGYVPPAPPMAPQYPAYPQQQGYQQPMQQPYAPAQPMPPQQPVQPQQPNPFGPGAGAPPAAPMG